MQVEEDIVIIIIYDNEKKTILLTYMYYTNGPILHSKEENPLINVNQ